MNNIVNCLTSTDHEKRNRTLKHLYLYYFTFLLVRFAEQTKRLFYFLKVESIVLVSLFYDYTLYAIKHCKLFSTRKETFVKKLSY